MQVHHVLELEPFARAQIRAGRRGLDRAVSWAHVVEQPDPKAWVRSGQLMLTTGHALTGSAVRQRQIVRELGEVPVAGIVLAVPTYFDTFPSAMLDVADELALPLIEIPFEIPFVDVTEALHRMLLTEQFRLVETAERMHRELTAAASRFRGLQDLAEALGHLLNRAVVIEAADGMVLAHHRLGSDEDATRQRTLATGCHDPDYVDHVERSGLLDALREGTAPLRIPGTSDGVIASRVVCPVRVTGELVGYIWVIEGVAPLSELDLLAAEHSAAVAALQVAHQRDLWRAEQRLGATLLDTLLELEGDPSVALLERARLIGLRDELPWRLVTIVLPFALPLGADDLRTRDQLAARWRGRLLDEGEPVLVSAHLDAIVALVPAELDVGRIATDAAVATHQVLVGREGSRLTEVRERYEDLLSMRPHTRGPGIHEQDAFLLPRVLAGDARARDEFLRRTLNVLDETKGSADLPGTLRALCETGFSLSATAEFLQIHISTLRYRLERLEAILGRDLRDPSVRFELQLACAVQRYCAPGRPAGAGRTNS